MLILTDGFNLQKCCLEIINRIISWFFLIITFILYIIIILTIIIHSRSYNLVRNAGFMHLAP
jgi:hypothetical protein